MKLNKYDNKCIKLYTKDGLAYEGICTYHNKDYIEHEYGFPYDALMMSSVLFCNDEINKIEVIDEFTDKYGLLEKTVVEAGVELVEDVLESEEDISIYRLLLCLEENLNDYSTEDIEELIPYFESLIKYNKDEKIVELSRRLKNEYTK